MIRALNRHDIQGNILRAYGRYSYPIARYFFLHIEDPRAGRQFIENTRWRVTSAAIWDKGSAPPVTFNIGFSSTGLRMLELPTRTLQGLPDEFVDGMKARAFLLGDRDPAVIAENDQSWDRDWDKIWRDNRSGDGPDVHIWISMNARVAWDGTDQPVPELEERIDWLKGECDALDGKVRILATQGRSGTQDQLSASAIFAEIDGKRYPTAKEHFGFTDGIGDPVFAGQYADHAADLQKAKGRGKWLHRDRGADGWEPLATGEFLLGHPDESQELPPTAQPPNFMHNGSFMVFRKLHQNVTSFRETIQDHARTYAGMMEVDMPEAEATLRAKMLGRWSDGVPLSLQPDYTSWQTYREARGFNNPDPMKAAAAMRDFLRSPEASDFRYADDMEGYKCPLGAHIRRSHTRDMLDPRIDPKNPNHHPTSQLNKRRRILRRGLPYGPGLGVETSDDTEQGVAFMAIGASIFRQFEFVQQQWLQYGLDFNQGNNTCPIVGRHDRHGQFLVPADPATGQLPFLMTGLKSYVETRGGEYFFLPSLTALGMLAYGVVDPT